MKSFLAIFQGKKTYIISVLLVLSSIGTVAGNLSSLITGDMTWANFMASPALQTLLGGFGLGFLRAGVVTTFKQK